MFPDRNTGIDISAIPDISNLQCHKRQCLSPCGPPSSLFNTESPVELARVIDQDRIITQAMGGPLHGLPPLPSEAKVLDLACGPGGWVLDVAFERSDIEVAGIDSSASMIAYANARVRSQRRRNASFGVMDITQSLDFAEGTFDLINARFLAGVLKRPCWLPLCEECLRLLKPGGMLRLTEAETLGVTNSPTFERLSRACVQLMRRLGYGWATQETAPLTSSLPALLQEASYNDIQTIAHALDFSSNTEVWIDQFWNVQLIIRRFRPLLGIPHYEFDRLLIQMQIEMQQPEFHAIWPFISILGTKPEGSSS